MEAVTCAPTEIVVVSQPPPPPAQQVINNNMVGGGGFSNASLYVGDLDSSVTETDLYDLFSQVAPVLSVRVCRDKDIRVSLGYAYVNLASSEAAKNAMRLLNFTPLGVGGKPIRIMFSHRDPSMRKSGKANLFIKDLDSSVDNKGLYDTFSKLGNVLSCKIVTDSNGKSKGYGFVQFDKEEIALTAIEKLDKMYFNDKKVSIGFFVRKQERDRRDTNVYVKNLSGTVTDEYLKKVFGSYGNITSAVVMRHEDNGSSKGFGFVNFNTPEEAASAIENLNGYTHDDKVWYCGKAQKKHERQAELRSKFNQERNGRLETLHGVNLYLKNLDDSMDDESLKSLFSQFGTITSSKVMLDSQGQSRGCGFVAFSNPEEATKAVNEMNGKMIGKKPLYVAVAQRKEERKARLQAHFSQIRTPGIAHVPLGMPGFHPGGPRFGPQPLYFGPGSPGSISPQLPPGYGYVQQQLLPGVRPGPFILPPYQFQRQGQPGQRVGFRRGTTPQQMQQQHLIRNANQGLRYMRNGLEPSLMPQAPVMPSQRSGPVPLVTLASALASADPEQQRQMLGEQLFPLVKQIESDSASKITGMILEMDKTEVLHLIEAPDALRKKVDEAMDVLKRSNAESIDDVGQLNTLSLND